MVSNANNGIEFSVFLLHVIGKTLFHNRYSPVHLIDGIIFSFQDGTYISYISEMQAYLIVFLFTFLCTLFNSFPIY